MTSLTDEFPFEASGINYSNLLVMHSAAGFYIGREAWDEEMVCPVPGSRESTYYETQDEAQADLDGNNFQVRQCEENKYMYMQCPEMKPNTSQ